MLRLKALNNRENTHRREYARTNDVATFVTGCLKTI